MSHPAIAPGTPVLVGTTLVPLPALRAGDQLLPVMRKGELLVISGEAYEAARLAVDEAAEAARLLAALPPARIDAFFRGFAQRLADEAAWAEIERANAADVASAAARGRSTTRLAVSEKMRADMIAGLRGWADTPPRVGRVLERRQGDGFTIERRCAPLGVVAFVFEGRPNVFADGAGVVRNGNAAVMRIGADALGTALAIERHALAPSLSAAGLPTASVRLVHSKEHGAAQALFTLEKVRLAVARGSGETVALLGAIAEQHGIPASLHGTGGAWMYVEKSAPTEAVANAVRHSLDRKVCNTLNVLLLERAARDEHGPTIARVLSALGARVHVVTGSEGVVPGEAITPEALGTEWEWERVPELTFMLVDDLAHAARAFNRHSPRFVASILSARAQAFDEFYAAVDAPYVGNAFTRWVDGQWAYERPELGLTNWERGRLLGRSGILSGDDIVSVRDVFLDHTARALQKR